MPLMALRGATTIAADDAALLAEATQELLRTLLERNALDVGRVTSATFTSTADLTPDAATAARHAFLRDAAALRPDWSDPRG